MVAGVGGIGGAAATRWNASDKGFAQLARVDASKLPARHKVSAGERRKQHVQNANRKKYEEILAKYDKNQDGKIDKDEFRKVLAGVTSDGSGGGKAYATKTEDVEEVDFIFDIADKDKSGGIARGEVLPAFQMWETWRSIRVQMEAKVKELDTDKSGALSKSEVKELLMALNEGKPVTDEEVEWVFSQADANKDGKIDKLELFLITLVWYRYADDPSMIDEPSKKKDKKGCACTVM